MQSKKNWAIGSIIAIVFIGIIGYVVFRNPGKETPSVETNKKGDNSIGVEGTGDFTVEEVPSQSAIPIPSLSRPINVIVSLSQESEAIVTARLKQIIDSLKKNPNQLSLWLELGVYRKTIGDYEGAREAWEYAATRESKNYIAQLNLANLYTQEIKNYPLAERHRLKVIELNPSEDAYEQLYQLYRYNYKEKEQFADDILIKGLERFFDSISLRIDLARYYKETGNSTSARMYYKQAIAIAVKNKNTLVEQSIREELAALSK